MRKLGKIKTNAVLALILAAIITTGCGSSNYAAKYDSMDGAGAAATESYATDDIYTNAIYDDSYEADAEEAVEESDSGSSAADTPVATNRKLIKRVDLTAETTEFDALIDNLQSKVAGMGGYVENSSIGGNGYNSSSVRTASFTVRVPAGKLDELVKQIGDSCNVTNKSETAEDITLQYVDTQSRKEALEVEQERMMVLLGQAEDVDTIIALESRLTEIRYELQNIESRLRTYDNLVDFATVSVYVKEVKVYSEPEVVPESDWERMVNGFARSVMNVLVGLKEFFIGLIIDLPYLVIWGIIIFVIVKIFKAFRRRKNKDGKKKEKKGFFGKKKNHTEEANTESSNQIDLDVETKEKE